MHLTVALAAEFASAQAPRPDRALQWEGYWHKGEAMRMIAPKIKTPSVPGDRDQDLSLLAGAAQLASLDVGAACHGAGVTRSNRLPNRHSRATLRRPTSTSGVSRHSYAPLEGW